MADQNRKIDQNYKATMAGVTNDANEYIRTVKVNPSTDRLLVENSALDSTLDSVSITNSNLAGGSISVNLVSGSLGSISLSAGTATSIDWIGGVRQSGGSISVNMVAGSVTVGSLQISDGTISSGTVKISSGSVQLMGTNRVLITDPTGAEMDLFKQGDNFAVGSDHGLGILGLNDGTPQKYAFIRVEGTNDDAEDPLTTGALSAETYGMVFNGSKWDRVRGDLTSGTWVNIKGGSVTISDGTIKVSSISSLPTVIISNGTISSGTVNVASGSIQLMGTSNVNATISLLPTIILSDGTTKISSVSTLPTVIISGGTINSGTVNLNTGTINVNTVSTVSTVSTITSVTGGTIWAVGNVAHDGTDSGNPVKIGGKVATGSVAITPVSGDRIDASYDVLGHQFVRNDNLNRWGVNLNSATAYGSTLVLSAPSAGTSIYITDMMFSFGTIVSATATIFMGRVILARGSSGATVVFGPVYFSGGSTSVFPFEKQFLNPVKVDGNGSLVLTTQWGTTAPSGHSIFLSGFYAP